MMNPNEVIERLERIRNSEYIKCTEKTILYDNKAIEAINIAITAVEKQIPKKAVGTHYAYMRCPACNHRIPSGGGSSSRRRDNWCNYCGQKIDWDRKELN